MKQNDDEKNKHARVELAKKLEKQGQIGQIYEMQYMNDIEIQWLKEMADREPDD